MADHDIDVSSAQYTQLLNGLGTLRTFLAPRVALIRKLPRAKQRLWLARDPLLRRTIKLAQVLVDWKDEELAE